MVLVTRRFVDLLPITALFLLTGGDCSSNNPSSNTVDRHDFALSSETLDGFGPGPQDWGFVTVRDGAHTFWWLYRTTADVASATERPLAIWLQGGPGASSSGFGNFEEIGPLDLDLAKRNFTWVKDMNVLFIDSPVGSGFSYVDDDKYLARDNAQIADDLVQLLRGFYALHPEFETVPLHIFGESYGGKVAVELAYVLHKAIKAKTIKSDLASVNSIDGWISPIDSVLSWAPFLLHLGFVDHDGHEQIMRAANATRILLEAGKFEEATTQWFFTESIIFNVSGPIDFYNVMNSVPMGKLRPLDTDGDEHMNADDSRDDDDRKLCELMNGRVKKALNISEGIVWGNQSGQTFQTLSVDFMKPATHFVELLLNETSIDVSIITGQLDLIVATPGTVNWVNRIRWKEYDDFVATPRAFLPVGGVLEAYVKHHKQFRMYWVNRAGHMVPLDNPRAMDAILRQVTKYDYDKE